MYFLVVTEWGNMECLWFFYPYWWEVTEKIVQIQEHGPKIDWAHYKYMYKYINVGLGGYEQREQITNFLAQQTT